MTWSVVGPKIQRDDTANEPEYIRKSESFALTDKDMGNIQRPALILEGEKDTVFKGQAGKLASGLKAPHKRVVMLNSEGAGEHCRMGAIRLLHQTIFDWPHMTFDPHSYAAFVPMGRIGQPDEIADVVVWLTTRDGTLIDYKGWMRGGRPQVVRRPPTHPPRRRRPDRSDWHVGFRPSWSGTPN